MTELCCRSIVALSRLIITERNNAPVAPCQGGSPKPASLPSVTSGSTAQSRRQTAGKAAKSLSWTQGARQCPPTVNVIANRYDPVAEMAFGFCYDASYPGGAELGYVSVA